jgi:hypothetical protein
MNSAVYDVFAKKTKKKISFPFKVGDIIENIPSENDKRVFKYKVVEINKPELKFVIEGDNGYGFELEVWAGIIHYKLSEEE